MWGCVCRLPDTPFLQQSNLLANSFNCDCRLAWLGDWLRSRKIVTGNPRCQRPGFLKEIPLQDVALPDFRCDEGNAKTRSCSLRSGPASRSAHPLVDSL